MYVIEADPSHLSVVAQLFDSYRQFNQQPADLAGATAFIRQRFERNDSRLFVALDEAGCGLGFTQLYPLYSSVAMKRMWCLNDLFVLPAARSQGVAQALLAAANHLALDTDAVGVRLATAADNLPAIKLYEKAGYSKIVDFDHYARLAG